MLLARQEKELATGVVVLVRLLPRRRGRKERRRWQELRRQASREPGDWLSMKKEEKWSRGQAVVRHPSLPSSDALNETGCGHIATGVISAHTELPLADEVGTQQTITIRRRAAMIMSGHMAERLGLLNRNRKVRMRSQLWGKDGGIYF